MVAVSEFSIREVEPASCFVLDGDFAPFSCSTHPSQLIVMAGY